MKIKVTQLDDATRSTVALALELYASSVHELCKNTKEKYMNIGQAVRHGEVLLCEYVYTEKEEGGDHGE